ncbi:MAG: hypothetical protein IT364_11455 [Candidatus Hydrogenedentes bacterium]|nr:hypothetical protein [Candidatus Hydrogenedentota bacterium]
MDAIERRLREFRPVQPPERLRQRVLAGEVSEWAIEWARWRRTLRWALALYALTFVSVTWSERDVAVRLAQIELGPNNGLRERIITVKLESIIPDEADAELRRYFANQAMTPPEPRGTLSESSLLQQLDAM